jgi:hypothetical protein
MSDEDMILQHWKHPWKWPGDYNDYMYGDKIYTKNIHPTGRVLMRFARGDPTGHTGWMYIQDNGEFLWNVNAKIKYFFKQNFLWD